MASLDTKKILKKNTQILTLSKICYKLHLNFAGRIISRKRVFSTFKRLKNMAQPFLNAAYDFENAEIIDSKSSPIFVMWLQGGEEVMPEAVKMCFNSLKKRCNTHPIYLISEKNLAEYIDLPSEINEKFKDGRISRAFFSDIVRASLLYKYGGTWIDSTVFVSSELPEEYFEKEFYSPRGFDGIKKREWKYFFDECQGWSAWFMGTNRKNYPLFKFLTDFYAFYFKENESILDYFQNDFCISLFYKYNSHFNKYMNSQKPSNSKAYLLAEFMNKTAKENIIKKLDYLSENPVNKLTYKRDWQSTNKKGEKTIYSIFLKEKL